MQHVISSNNLQALQQKTYVTPTTRKISVLQRFLQWCDKQEDNRFLWLGIALMGNIGMVLPFTMLAVIFASGNNFILFVLTCVANVPVLALNLAAQPTKVTLPALFTASVINLAVILTSLSVLFFS